MANPRTVILVTAALLCASLAFAGGSGEKKGAAPGAQPSGARVSYPMSVVDDTGASITIPEKPRRIVSLTLFTDEILLSLVDKGRILAVTTYAVDPQISNVSAPAADIPNKMTLNVEAIVGLQPDLVFVANWSQADKVSQMRDAGLPVVLLKSALSVPAISRQIEEVARIVGEPEKGAGVVSEMKRRIDAVSKRVSAVPEARRVRALDYEVSGVSMGGGTSWDEITRAAGLVNAVGGLAVDEWGQVPMSKEKLLELDPDLLVLPGWVYGDPKGADSFESQVLGDPALKALKAIKSGRVVQMPGRLKSACSQYIAEAIEFLAEAAYSER